MITAILMFQKKMEMKKENLDVSKSKNMER